jgi:hypothetical protein
MNAVEKNLLAKSKEYAELREQLRGRARAYAQDRVGGSNANSRARNMLASAFDAGGSGDSAVARENERDESAPEPEQDAEEEHVWEVGEYCVWTEHPEYGSARIKWIGSKVLFGTKRCKLYFERFDRVEEATLRELALIEVVR